MTTLWNPADKTTHLTLGDGNHSATQTTTGENGGARATTSHSSGKWYLEYASNVISGFHSKRGFGTAAQDLTSYDSVHNFGLGEGGAYDIGGGNLGSPAGHTVEFCVDIDAGKYWVRYDGGGGWYGASGSIGATTDPTNGVNGSSYTSIIGAGLAIFPLFITFANSGQLGSTTINCGDRSFVDGPPAGFTAWDSVPPFTQSFGTIVG